MKIKLREIFGNECSPLKELDHEVAQKEKEIRQCERVLEIMATKERLQIMENPYQVNDILLESIRVRKECENRLNELAKELDLLYERKEEIGRFAESDDVCKKLHHALEVFKKSPSLRKKQLIQVMLPRLVVDEKRDELNFLINPLLDKSFKNEDLDKPDFEAFLTLEPESLDRKKNGARRRSYWKYCEKRVSQ